MRALAAGGIVPAFAGACGSAAANVRQPVQQSSIQGLLLSVWPSGKVQSTGKIGMADDAARLRGGGSRHLRAAEIGDQAGKRNRIGCRKRYETLLQQPLAKKPVHRPNPNCGSPQTTNTLAAKKIRG